MSKTQKQHLRVSALLAGIVLCVGVLMFFVQTASASKTANKSYTASDSINVNEYSREGSTVTLTKTLSKKIQIFNSEKRLLNFCLIEF